MIQRWCNGKQLKYSVTSGGLMLLDQSNMKFHGFWKEQEVSIQSDLPIWPIVKMWCLSATDDNHREVWIEPQNQDFAS